MLWCVLRGAKRMTCRAAVQLQPRKRAAPICGGKVLPPVQRVPWRVVASVRPCIIVGGVLVQLVMRQPRVAVAEAIGEPCL